MLIDGDATFAEPSIVLVHLHIRPLAPAKMVPSWLADALKKRILDRCYGVYVMSAMQASVRLARNDTGLGDPKPPFRALAQAAK